MPRWLWPVIVLLAGSCMAVQSRVNGELAARIDDGVAAALVSFVTGALLSGSLSLVLPAGRRGVRRLFEAIRGGAMPWWYTLTGVIGSFVVATQGLAVPTLGVALFTVGIVAGQSLSSILVDRVGFGVLAARRISPSRVAGAAITFAAVVVSVAGAFGIGSGVALVVLPVVAGVLMSVQQAFAGQVQHHSGSALTQTTSNFVVGTVVLGIVVAVRAGLGDTPLALPPDWWLYLGGPLGCVFIAIAAVAVHRIGILVVGLASVAGQVVCSLALDLVVPAGHEVTAWSFAGAALAIVGVAVSVLRVRRRRGEPRRAA